MTARLVTLVPWSRSEAPHNTVFANYFYFCRLEVGMRASEADGAVVDLTIENHEANTTRQNHIRYATYLFDP